MQLKVKKEMVSQHEANLRDPEEHFLWALRNLPMIAGAGMMTFSGFLRGWSKHLWECGFAHCDYLASLADEDGNIPVSRLPKQQIRFREAFKGPQHSYNPAARWARDSDPEPPTWSVPDVTKLTDQENWLLAYELKARGFVFPDEAMPATAEEFNERQDDDGLPEPGEPGHPGTGSE